ncbi:MAG: hypothetical protein J2P37_04470 [Ktedonobacteraceae bacterium]|nr:hypothetical protein [Ktedonobacteraceae bacterium]
MAPSRKAREVLRQTNPHLFVFASDLLLQRECLAIEGINLFCWKQAMFPFFTNRRCNSNRWGSGPMIERSLTGGRGRHTQYIQRNNQIKDTGSMGSPRWLVTVHTVLWPFTACKRVLIVRCSSFIEQKRPLRHPLYLQ